MKIISLLRRIKRFIIGKNTEEFYQELLSDKLQAIHEKNEREKTK